MNVERLNIKPWQEVAVHIYLVKNLLPEFQNRSGSISSCTVRVRPSALRAWEPLHSSAPRGGDRLSGKTKLAE